MTNTQQILTKAILDIENKGLDGLLITNESNVKYLSSFTGDSSVLLISKNGNYLFTDPRYIEEAEKECSNQINVTLWYKDRRFGHETYKKAIDEAGIKKLGFESASLTFESYDYLKNNLSAEIIPTNNIVEKLRYIKQPEEINILKRACEISDLALQKTVGTIKEGQTEKEIAALLEYNMRLAGADNISFETICLTGARTSLLHGKPSDAKLKKGDFLLFDFGALVDSYHADISRTFVVGKADDKHKEVYQIIKDCQQAIIDNIKQGVHISNINSVINQMIPEKYKPHFYPGYGHGVGLVIHEQPFMKDEADFTFQKNMVVTVEPGIYIPNWGGLRIEDTILVTENGSEQLTQFNNELICL